MTEEQRTKLILRCNAALKRNPNCVWARNELKYLDVKEIDGGGIMVSAGAYKADQDYHGGYTE